MNMTIKYKHLFFGFFIFFSAFSIAQEKSDITQEFELEIESEFRYFYKDALFTNQEKSYPSIAFRPEYTLEWSDGYESINFKGFFRFDRDNERTHWDIRELYYQKAVLHQNNDSTKLAIDNYNKSLRT